MARKIWIGTDGDLTASGNWSPANLPTTADDVVFPAGSGNITTNLDGLSAVALNAVEFESGYTQTIGTEDDYMALDPDSFVFGGSGLAFIDLQTATTPVDIVGTASASLGQYGLTLNGSAISTLTIDSGALKIHPTATITTLEVRSGADVLVPEGATVTTINNMGGTIVLADDTTNLNNVDGTTQIEGSAIVGTTKIYRGTITSNSSGTHTTVYVYGGTYDLSKSSVARTVTTLEQHGGEVVYNPNIITLTNAFAADRILSVETV